MESVSVVDCTTGEQVIREMTAEETADRHKLRTAVADISQARAAEQAAHAATLAHIADKVGVGVDDLKAALRCALHNAEQA